MTTSSERPHLQMLSHSADQPTAYPSLPKSAEQILHVHRISHRPDLVVIRLEGEVDVMSVKLLQRALWQGLTAATVLDLSGVTFLGAAGLGAIACAAERARAEHRRLGLVITTHLVARPLHLCGMDELLPTYTTLSDALRELARPPAPAVP